VLVEFTITTDGSVTDARILHGIPLLNARLRAPMAVRAGSSRRPPLADAHYGAGVFPVIIPANRKRNEPRVEDVVRPSSDICLVHGTCSAANRFMGV
jgi:hypothetical protein